MEHNYHTSVDVAPEWWFVKDPTLANIPEIFNCSGELRFHDSLQDCAIPLPVLRVPLLFS